MVKRPDYLDDAVEVHLTKIGVLKDLRPDGEWFQGSLEGSRRAVELGKAEMARELAAYAAGNDYDGS